MAGGDPAAAPGLAQEARTSLMDAWKSVLRADPTGWLLEAENPSVRYFALRELCDRPQDDPEVQQVRREIMQRGPVPALLERQAPGGYWGKPEDFYVRAKYRGTVWTFQLLAELGADGDDARVRRACEFVLSASQHRESGGFAYQSSPLEGGDPQGVIPCLTGNMLFALIRFGCLDDPRVQAGLAWILRYQRLDDKDGPAPSGWPYDGRFNCWGRHTCHLGVVKALKALAEIPPEARTGEIDAMIQRICEYLLIHRIYQSSHHPGKVAMPRWLEFGFPRFYQSDIVEILLLLARAGWRDARMQPAIDVLLSKQNEQGRWMLEESYNDRMLVRVERQGQPSKWVTLWALRALKGYFSEPGASSAR
jgi:hypothetical protein